MISEILDRVPPQNQDAERQTLGCAILQPRILDDMASMIRPEDFYTEPHQVLCAHLFGMAQHDVRVDAALLIDRLRECGDLERIGGTADMHEILTSVAVWQHWRSHTTIVLRDSRRRQLLHAATEILSRSYEDLPEDVLAKAEELFGAIKTGSYDTEPVTMQAATLEALRQIHEIADRQEKAGIMSGLEVFDTKFGGFFPGELAVVGARPGQGKTSLLMQMASHMAEHGRCVYFASLEMDAAILARKRLCTASGVSSQRVRTGSINADDVRALSEAGSTVASQNFHIHDWAAIRPYDIERSARRVGAEIAFVDYLQIVTSHSESRDRYVQVGAIARALKEMARKLNIPVVAAAQLGRQAEQFKEAQPKLSHLRESGNIEQDCDMALLLYRPGKLIDGVGKFDGQQYDAELNVAKNRNGATGEIALDWDGDTTTFRCHSSFNVPASGEWDASGWMGDDYGEEN